MHCTWTKLKNAHELEENCNCNTHHRQNIKVLLATLPYIDTRIYKKQRKNGEALLLPTDVQAFFSTVANAHTQFCITLQAFCIFGHTDLKANVKYQCEYFSVKGYCQLGFLYLRKNALMFLHCISFNQKVLNIYIFLVISEIHFSF